uniref:Uncharacterized protein n=1 Tax=Rhizophora mucronata TaxID=61149 RepID=A0A2P2PV68_RHIMU
MPKTETFSLDLISYHQTARTPEKCNWTWQMIFNLF